MMQDWVLAASSHEPETRKSLVEPDLLLHAPKFTSLHMHASLGLVWNTLQGSESLSTGVKSSQGGFCALEFLPLCLLGSLWEPAHTDPFEVSSGMGELLCSPGPRRRAQPSLLPHPSTPGFHLLLMLLPSLRLDFISSCKISQHDLLFFYIYNKYLGKEYSACVEVAKCSTEMPKVASVPISPWVLQKLSCGIRTESPCWTGGLTYPNCAAMGRLLQLLEFMVWKEAADISLLPCSMMVAL